MASPDRLALAALLLSVEMSRRVRAQWGSPGHVPRAGSSPSCARCLYKGECVRSKGEKVSGALYWETSHASDQLK